MTKLDATDRNLIAMLKEDARLSTSELSRRLGTARTTISERIARLEREGVILGYSAIVKAEDNVFETRAMVSLICDRTSTRAVVTALRAFPEIEECLTVTGRYDLVCMVRTPHQEDLDALMDEISMIPGVRTADATIALANKFSRRSMLPQGTTQHLRVAI